MKQAIFVCAITIELKCPDKECGGVCVNDRNSSYGIEHFDEQVTCENCGSQWKVPGKAFRKHTEK